MAFIGFDVPAWAPSALHQLRQAAVCFRVRPPIRQLVVELGALRNRRRSREFDMQAAGLHNFTINFGRPHPAPHGVLRLVLEVDDEVFPRVDPHIGLLHGGTEKLIEHETYLQSIGSFDRLDYVALMNQGHALCLAVEMTARPRGAATWPIDPRALP